MTLVELTLVIFVLMGMIGTLFVGARAWKRGADRSNCILNLHIAQKAVRGYANFNGYVPGETVDGLHDKIFTPGGLVSTLPVCAAGGHYTCGAASGENTIPAVGEIYMKCSFGNSHDHEPLQHSEW